MIPSIPRLSDYDVSVLHGFLPTEPPLEVLPNPYFDPWETALRNLQSLMLTRRLRPFVDRLPVLDRYYLLKTEPEWRRAYLVLGFLAHAYIWGGDTPSEVGYTAHHPGLRIRRREADNGYVHREYHRPSRSLSSKPPDILNCLLSLHMHRQLFGIGSRFSPMSPSTILRISPPFPRSLAH